MKNKLVLFLFFLLIQSNAYAQDLHIKVIDETTKIPVSYALITWKHGNTPTIQKTNITGEVIITQVVFPLALNLSHVSYEKILLNINQSDVINKQGHWYYTINLRPISYRLDNTIITGRVVPVLSANSIYKVKIISKSEIERRAAVSLTDVLQFELNQYISNDNILGSSANIGGMSGANVKILLNGVPVNGSEAGFIDLNQLNLANVKRIETIQGPMSIMYGSNAMGGVINLITNDAKQKLEGGAQGYVESNGKVNVSAHVGTKKDKHSFQVSGARNYFQGWSPMDSINRWMLWKPKTQYTADINYGYTLPKGRLGFYSYYLNEMIENKGAPNESPFKVFALDEYYHTQRLRNTLNLDYALSKTEFFSAQNTFSIYDRKKNRYYKDLVTLDKRLTGDIEDQDSSLFKQYHFRGALQSSRMKQIDEQIGYEINYESGRSTKLANREQRMYEIGFFNSTTYSYKRLSIMPSLRYNINTRYANTLAYGLHLKYSTPKELSVRASVAKGYRTPSLKELYLQFIDNNHQILGNDDLKQEIGFHTEITAEKTWTKYETTWTLEAAIMTNKLDNKITYAAMNSQGTSFQYMNIDIFRNLITNLSLQYQAKSFNASLGLSQSAILESNINPSGSTYECILNSSYLIPKIDTRINLFYRYNYHQPVYFIDGSFAWSDPMHVSNITASKAFLDNTLNIQLGIKNLFNIQRNTNSGSSVIINSPHNSESNSTLLLPRSGFFQILYKI